MGDGGTIRRWVIALFVLVQFGWPAWALTVRDHQVPWSWQMYSIEPCDPETVGDRC